MKVNFGFSYVGFIFLLMLIIPNIIWTKNKPENYDEYAKNENKVLLAFERTGEVLVSCLSLIFSDFNIKISARLPILIAAMILMLLYEMYWIRYFRSAKKMSDFYTSFLKIPLAGAVLPIAAFLLMGIYGKNIFMICAVIILAVGHIGIHAAHKKEIGR